MKVTRLLNKTISFKRFEKTQWYLQLIIVIDTKKMTKQKNHEVRKNT